VSAAVTGSHTCNQESLADKVSVSRENRDNDNVDINDSEITLVDIDGLGVNVRSDIDVNNASEFLKNRLQMKFCVNLGNWQD
jgi:hypothetical protein